MDKYERSSITISTLKNSNSMEYEYNEFTRFSHINSKLEQITNQEIAHKYFG